MATMTRGSPERIARAVLGSLTLKRVISLGAAQPKAVSRPPATTSQRRQAPIETSDRYFFSLSISSIRLQVQWMSPTKKFVLSAISAGVKISAAEQRLAEGSYEKSTASRTRVYNCSLCHCRRDERKSLGRAATVTAADAPRPLAPPTVHSSKRALSSTGPTLTL
jgi:hypothetical protein